MLLSNLIKIWPHNTVERREDFLSECFAELLRNDDEFLSKFLKLLSLPCDTSEDKDCRIDTQHSFRRSRFDLFLEYSVNRQPTTVVLENKIGAGLGEYEDDDVSGRKVDQIQKYLSYGELLHGLHVVHMGKFLLSDSDGRDYVSNNRRFHQIEWGRIARMLLRFPGDPDTKRGYLRKSLYKLLEALGMGDQQFTPTEIVGATRYWQFKIKTQRILGAAKDALPVRDPYDFSKINQRQWSDYEGLMGYWMQLPPQSDIKLCMTIRYSENTEEPDIPDLQFHLESQPSDKFNKFLRSGDVLETVEAMKPYCAAHHIVGGQELHAKWRVLNYRMSMRYVLGADDQDQEIINFYSGLYAELDKHGLWDRILAHEEEGSVDVASGAD